MAWCLIQTVLIILTVPSSVYGQAEDSRSVEISDGRFYIDGTEIPVDELPANLNLNGIRAEYHFSGTVDPVIRLNGQLYRVGNNELEAVSEAGAAVTGRLSPVDGMHVAMHARQQHLEELREQMKSVREASSEYRELERQARQLQAELGRFEEQFVRQSVYMDNLRQQNESLYGRLTEEQRMEMETHQLAAQILTENAGDSREAMTEELKDKLDRIFEIKQQNRREEIRQLEDTLDELQERLDERERMRERIIEHRLNQLLGRRHPGEW